MIILKAFCDFLLQKKYKQVAFMQRLKILHWYCFIEIFAICLFILSQKLQIVPPKPSKMRRLGCTSFSLIPCLLLVFFSSYLYSMSLHNMRCWSSVILYPSVHPPHPFSSCWRGHNITFFSWTIRNNSFINCGYGEHIVFYGDNNCDLISWYGDSNSFTEKHEKEW